MTPPLVSICLPNLDTYPYLRERVGTILARPTRTGNSSSATTSRTMARGSCSKSSPVRTRGFPSRRHRARAYIRTGTAVLRARGVSSCTVATSDDGMAPDCLEKLVQALERHPECDAAHCSLVVVDEVGNTLAEQWWRQGLFDSSLPELVNRPHVRRAPYDGLLCLSGEQVYYSITEWPSGGHSPRESVTSARWGSVSHFQRHMRVALPLTSRMCPTRGHRGEGERSRLPIPGGFERWSKGLSRR